MKVRQIRSASADNRFEGLTVTALNELEKQTVVSLALAVLAVKHRGRRKLCSPDDTQAYIRLKLNDSKNEVFGAVFLDNRHRVIKVSELFQGTIDGAAVYPRVVVETALDVNAAAIIFFHNHPSGVAEPSSADERITTRLIKALALIDVRVLDHIVVGDDHSVSFAERGLL